MPGIKGVQDEKATVFPFLPIPRLTIAWIPGRKSLLTLSEPSARSSAGKDTKGCLSTGISIREQIPCMPAGQNLTIGGIANLVVSRSNDLEFSLKDLDIRFQVP